MSSDGPGRGARDKTGRVALGGSHAAWRGLGSVLAPLFVLVLGAAILEPIGRRLAANEEGLPPGRLADAGGTGAGLALLGGFRELAADSLWLETNAAWERRDAPRTLAMLRAAVAVDGRPGCFWLNGARMIAYDMPEWRIEAEPDAPRAVAEGIRRQQAEQALEFLGLAAGRGAGSAEIWIEMARISEDRAHDPVRAAEYFRRAAEIPGAPYYAGRRHAQLLVEMGRNCDAIHWLRRWLPTLPSDDPAACVGETRQFLDRLVAGCGRRGRKIKA